MAICTMQEVRGPFSETFSFCAVLRKMGRHTFVFIRQKSASKTLNFVHSFFATSKKKSALLDRRHVPVVNHVVQELAESD